MRRAVFLLAAALGTGAAGSVAAEDVAAALNDYPTAVRADYVFACMAVNGQGRDVLQKCACSIDTIASILPYEDYVEAETVLSLQQVGGERMSMFRTAPTARAFVAELRRAQAEAEIVCFE
ncbi:hypothetical protein BYZ73_17910 [Rhodovulum viride]|uniref:HdeA/HdeB family protein n=1 Tax=Rhodovulum viride TaxID=1231134 RepID=A0ABX9DCA7_9RHOB|nr:hypothetical protein [Rhodovulum viride]RAP39962.1 hypothetical protein BYZ73_17910 [Rhodovulum viride]